MLKIKDGVCLISLGEEVLLLLQFDDSSAKTGVREKDGRVKCGVADIGHLHGTSFETNCARGANCGGLIADFGGSASSEYEQSIPCSLTGNTALPLLPMGRPRLSGRNSPT
jgi:hypothetical protein